MIFEIWIEKSDGDLLVNDTFEALTVGDAVKLAESTNPVSLEVGGDQITITVGRVE